MEHIGLIPDSRLTAWTQDANVYMLDMPNCLLLLTFPIKIVERYHQVIIGQDLELVQKQEVGSGKARTGIRVCNRKQVSRKEKV